MFSLHVDTARTWRGGQNQVLLTVNGLRSIGHRAALVAHPDGELRRRAAEGLDLIPIAPRTEMDLSAAFKFSRLIKRLEEILELPREQWPPSALRALWEPLRETSEGRFQTPRHESRWLNLAGFCLRPGTGFPLDEIRVKAIWPVFHQGVRHIKDAQCWAEWWILWRRIAAGLTRPRPLDAQEAEDETLSADEVDAGAAAATDIAVRVANDDQRR